MLDVSPGDIVHNILCIDIMTAMITQVGEMKENVTCLIGLFNTDKGQCGLLREQGKG